MSEDKYSNFNISRRLIIMVKSFWLHITGIFCLELLSVPLALLLPIPVKIAVDSVIGSEPLPGFMQMVVPQWIEDSKPALLWLAVCLQVTLVFVTRVEYLAEYILQTYTGEKMKLFFRQILFRHVQRLSFSFHDSRGTADSIFRIQHNAPAIRQITIDGFIPLLSSALKLIGMVCVISVINWQLALVALSVVPFLYVFADNYNKRMRSKYRKIQKLESNVLSIIQEVLTSFRVVKAFGMEENEQERFVHHANKTLKQRILLSVAEGSFGILINTITAIGTAAVIYLGVSHVLSGKITLGELLIVLTYLSQLYGPLKSISQQITNLQSSFVGASRALELLDEIPDVTEKPHAKALHRAKGLIEYEDVSFSYEEGNPILKDISFTIQPGSRVGIKGRTGAGKTTLVSLLPRFYDVSAGSILLDGEDVREFKLPDLRNQFSIVLQDSVLFSTTIAENIMYAKVGASEEEVIEAAKAANAHDFIMSLPDGYQTKVGERGMRLSGGERQRIALARAFLKDAPILLLDEPTSSVDTQTEELIMDAMERLMANRTTIMIAHRLTTLEKCDLLLEVVDGQLKTHRNVSESLAQKQS